MAVTSEKRRGADRRRFPRGGRRESDASGYTPLVYVVDPRSGGRDAAEAILAKLRFAVAPFDSVETARLAMNALKPDVVIVAGPHVNAMRRAMPPGRGDAPLPVVPLPDGEVSMALVEEIRRALRGALG